MICRIKLFISFFIVLLSFVSLYSKATTCPSVDTIKRVKGQYVWNTTVPGWNGYFVAPTSKGNSYKIEKFINATWVKTHDAADAPGFMQCDYSGEFLMLVKVKNPNYVKGKKTYQADGTAKEEPEFIEKAVNEVIRFTQANGNGATIPENFAKNWSCHSIVKFPDEACICFTDLGKCSFRLG